MAKRDGIGLGNRVAPPRFLAFGALFVAGVGAGWPALGWRHGLMIGFDLAALVFLPSVAPLLRTADADAMRRQALRNDANRAGLLAITGAVTLAILTAVAAELIDARHGDAGSILLVIGTLAIAWLFSNMIYALHYAHIFYLRDARTARGSGGIDFPGSKEQNYWDFIYFAFTLGMTFQTSDVEIVRTAVRRVVIFHCLAAFVFNIGVLAFTINVLGN